jgi:hypothetical protein
MTTRPGKTRGRGIVLAAALLIGAGAQTHAQTATTLADFEFNEGTGATTQSATNSLVGTLGRLIVDSDILSTNDTPSGAASDRAVALSGNGFLIANDTNSPVLAELTGPLTLEAWVKHDSTSTKQYEGIVSYGNSYKMGLNNTEILFTLFGIVDVPSGLFLPPDEWHHVAAVWEAGVGVTFYLDDVSTFISDTGAMRAFGNNVLSIGAEGLGNSFVGMIDRVRVHKALLTAEQIDTVAATPKATLPETLVSYDFNEAAMPYQSSKTPALPTSRGDVAANRALAPTFAKDSPTGGATDYSLEFTVAGQRVFVDDPESAITLDTGDFTIQSWVKFGAQPGARSVLFFDSGPGAAISFSVASRNVFVTTLGILDIASTATVPDDGGWHHIAVEHETGKEMRYYVDGILGSTVPYTGGVLIGVRTDPTFYIGSEPTGGLPFIGKLDRLKVTRGLIPVDELDFRAVPGVDPGAPELTIQTVVEVAWPSIPAGYKLQSTQDISNPASWVLVDATPTGSNGILKFYAPVTSTKTFYRLIQP